MKPRNPVVRANIEAPKRNAGRHADKRHAAGTVNFSQEKHMAHRNKQPFYHRVDGLLFTSTTGFGEEQFLEALRAFARSKAGRELGLLDDTIEIEAGGYGEPEPGDPTDLM